MDIEDGLLGCRGTVKSIEPSKLPNVVIVNIECEDANARFDVLKDLLTFKEGSEVDLLLTKERPDYNDGEDLVMWGYVMSKKVKRTSEKNINKLLISLWGYLLVLESPKDILDSFSVMDKVYLKISKAG
jgi:DNA-directed RNA polymerase subunit G